METIYIFLRDLAYTEVDNLVKDLRGETENIIDRVATMATEFAENIVHSIFPNSPIESGIKAMMKKEIDVRRLATKFADKRS